MKNLIAITASLFLAATPLTAQNANAAADKNAEKKAEQALSKQEKNAGKAAAKQSEQQQAKKAERQAKRAEKKAAREARKAAKSERKALRKAQQAANKASGKGNRADPKNPTDALAAKARHTEALLSRADVHGVGVSWKNNGDAVIKVLVDNKVTKEMALPALPKKLDGISVQKLNSGPIYALNVPCEERKYSKNCTAEQDDIAVQAQLTDGTAEAYSQTDWHERPVPIGVSIGADADVPGTLGCRVSRGCHNYVLTSSHIVADETSSPAMLQPSSIDGGLEEDTVAQLLEATRIILGTGPEVENRADASIFDIANNSVGTSTRSNGYGTPRAITREADLAMDVMKYGRSTAMTSGYVDAIDATVIVNYPEGEARFVNQLILRSKTSGMNFALPGDSGSLVVAETGDDERKPIGLLFASGKNVSVANTIDEVLYALDIEIDGDFE